MVLTLGSVDEILWFNHSNETSLAVLSHGTIYIYVFYKMKFGICLEFQCYALLGVKGLKEDCFKPLVDTVGYSSQTSCLLQFLLKPLLAVRLVRSEVGFELW